MHFLPFAQRDSPLGKDHCTAGLLFYWILFDQRQKIRCYFYAVQSKPVKLETSLVG